MRVITRRTLTGDDWAKLILGMTILLGLIVRVYPVLMRSFPLNDGGMFLVMIRELRANGFALPAFTSYNLSSIPFAYPPLGLYLAAFLNVLGFDELSILRWMPVAINASSIPGFYLMANEFLRDRPRAAVATAFYALTAGTYDWQIMGGGVTRAPGMLFLILSMWAMLRMFAS